MKESRTHRSRSRDRIKKVDSKKRRESDSDRSSSSLLSSDDSKERSENTNAAYELYKKMKKERREATATITNVHCRALDLEADFPNYKRKLVV